MELDLILNRNYNTFSKNNFFIEWDSIVDSIADAFSMSKFEKEWLKKNQIAKLIAAIPFIAKCGDAWRTSICHLGIYLLSLKFKHIAACKPSDNENIFKRLFFLNTFIGGEKKIIRKGISLIALNMLEDYKRDINEDKEIGKYNPLSAQTWNYRRIKNRLLKIITDTECREIDEIITINDAATGFWEYTYN